MTKYEGEGSVLMICSCSDKLSRKTHSLPVVFSVIVISSTMVSHLSKTHAAINAVVSRKLWVV